MSYTKEARRQSRRMSAIESLTDTLVGLLVSVCVTYFILPLWGLNPSLMEATEITLVYVVLSFVRKYIIRRFFNA
jgi:multisubunit Na+/H+ antiporter MnhF subunit